MNGFDRSSNDFSGRLSYLGRVGLWLLLAWLEESRVLIFGLITCLYYCFSGDPLGVSLLFSLFEVAILGGSLFTDFWSFCKKMLFLDSEPHYEPCLPLS